MSTHVIDFDGGFSLLVQSKRDGGISTGFCIASSLNPIGS